MATGDNALTGMCVSQKCGILNSEEYFIADLDDRTGKKQIVWDNEFRENIIGKEREPNSQPDVDGQATDDEVSLDATETQQTSHLGSKYALNCIKYPILAQAGQRNMVGPRLILPKVMKYSKDLLKSNVILALIDYL